MRTLIARLCAVSAALIVCAGPARAHTGKKAATRIVKPIALGAMATGGASKPPAAMPLDADAAPKPLIGTDDSPIAPDEAAPAPAAGRPGSRAQEPRIALTREPSGGGALGALGDWAARMWQAAFGGSDESAAAAGLTFDKGAVFKQLGVTQKRIDAFAKAHKNLEETLIPDTERDLRALETLDEELFEQGTKTDDKLEKRTYARRLVTVREKTRRLAKRLSTRRKMHTVLGRFLDLVDELNELAEAGLLPTEEQLRELAALVGVKTDALANLSQSAEGLNPAREGETTETDPELAGILDEFSSRREAAQDEALDKDLKESGLGLENLAPERTPAESSKKKDRQIEGGQIVFEDD